MDRERNHIHRTHRAIWAAAAVWMGCGRAPEVWEREPDYYVQHDVLEHVHRSHTSRTFPFAEHPTGQLTMTTEARGLRADEDVAVPHPRDGRFRVVVTGDSHTDGVVHNHEHFKEALADTLSARRAQAGQPGRRRCGQDPACRAETCAQSGAAQAQTRRPSRDRRRLQSAWLHI